MKYKDRFLVGKMARPDIWVERFFVGPQFADKYVKSGGYVIPASHLKIHEAPEKADERVVKEIVGIEPKKISLVGIQSHVSGEGREDAHWDLCAIYETKTPTTKITKPLWFSDLKFVESRKLSSTDFTRGHGDVLKELRLVK